MPEDKSIWPFISVIMPARNAAATLPRQLAAIIDQDYAGQWEVLVVDNGSSDGTAELLATWAGRETRVRWLAAAEQAGSYYARNQGAREARGELLAFCDADDEVRPGWLRALATVARDSDAVAGALIPVVDQHATTSRTSEGLPTVTMPVLLEFLPYGFTANFAVWKDSFWRVGGWRADYTNGGDADFCWRLQLSGHSLAFAPDACVVYTYRPTPSAVRRQFFRYAVAHVRLYRDYRQQGARRTSFAKGPSLLGLGGFEQFWTRLGKPAEAQPMDHREFNARRPRVWFSQI